MSDLHAALREHFGHADFRPGQEEAVAAALAVATCWS
jgi:superfamily II DNA helicase RecQ